ncbi:hypothetical protein EHQ58_01165 [Leptospira ognonensis]|uniref:Uncharacterized protein n=1 Tax=Leptospira ognonensis TaxID=2484945 RepID=A0A4V3JS34_9LEPT|nr:hypothetical protein [Leptospira ognonensis]TGL63090.1 hypothetical protein EHQ58_01165 [Leptospira ognonensis]
MKTKIRIIFTYIICHLISYFVVSIPYYQFVMKKYYVGEGAIFQRFLITESNPLLWAEAMRLFFPIQIINAFLFSILLVHTLDWLKKQSIPSILFFVFWSKGIISGLLAISPAPGNLEGVLFFIPDVSLKIHTLVALEMFMQALLVSLMFVIVNLKLWKTTNEN